MVSRVKRVACRWGHPKQFTASQPDCDAQTFIQTREKILDLSQWLFWTQTPKCRCCTWILNICRRCARGRGRRRLKHANKKSLILDRKVVAAYFRRLFTLRLIFYDKRWIWIALRSFCMVIKYECVANKEMNSIHSFEILLSIRYSPCWKNVEELKCWSVSQEQMKENLDSPCWILGEWFV